MKIVSYFLFLYFLVHPFGQLTRFQLNLAEMNLYLTDILTAFLVVLWFGVHLVLRKSFLWPPLTRQVLLFSLIACLSLLVNSLLHLEGRERVVAWLYLVRWIFYTGFYFVAFDLANSLANFKMEVKNVLLGVGLLLAFFGLIQYFFLPDTRFLESFGWDPHYYRLISTFFDPGYTGIILALSMILLFTFYFSSKDKREKKIYVVCGLIVYIALALTYSRASYLAYLVGLTSVAYVLRKPRFLAGAVILFLITIFLLPRPGGEGVRLERESTARFRVINWQQTFQISKDNWLLGVGFNAYRYSQRDYSFLPLANWRASHAGGGADSSLLFVFATTGILGLLAYLWFWGKALFTSYRYGQLLVLATILALGVHSFFVNSLFYPWVMSWYWVVLGVEVIKERR